MLNSIGCHVAFHKDVIDYVTSLVDWFVNIKLLHLNYIVFCHSKFVAFHKHVD